MTRIQQGLGGRFWIRTAQGAGMAELPRGGILNPIMLDDRIEIDPEVLGGKPVIRSTRIPVELVLRKLAEGATESDLLDAYPRLTREDIHAALAYAADSIAHEAIVLPRTAG